MPQHDIRALARRWFEEVWNQGRDEVIDELAAPDALVHGLTETGEPMVGRDHFRQFHRQFRSGFSDIQVTPRRGFQAENWVVLEGDFAGRSAEGVPFSVPFIVVMELDGELIRRSADYFDLNSVLTQIAAGQTTEAATPAA